MDNLSQSGQNVVLPEHVQQAIENARNNVSVLEAESTRLQKLVKEMKDNVEAKHSERVHLEKNIEILKKDLDSIIETTAKRSVELNNIEARIKTASDSLTAMVEKIDRSNKDFVVKMASLDVRDAALKKSEEEINKRHLDLIAKETDHAAKVEKLKRALE